MHRTSSHISTLIKATAAKDAAQWSGTESCLLCGRKLGTLVLEAVQALVDARRDGAPAAANGNATESSGDTATLLDLSGSRDFLTREAAEEALAAMFAENAALKKVPCRRTAGTRSRRLLPHK